VTVTRTRRRQTSSFAVSRALTCSALWRQLRLTFRGPNWASGGHDLHDQPRPGAVGDRGHAATRGVRVSDRTCPSRRA
jgi:hypothetical protein